MSTITSFLQLDLNGTYTYADYLSWEFSEYVELVNGRLLPLMPGRSPQHQRCLGALMMVVHSWLKKRPEEMVQIPFDVCPNAWPGLPDEYITTVVQPDLIVVSDTSKLTERGCFGPPDWVVEIVSSGFIGRDFQTKHNLYAEAGVREYWVIFPGEQTVLVYELDNNDRYQLKAEYAEPGPMPVATLPGLAIEWSEVFGDQL